MKLPFEVFPNCSAVDSLSMQTERRISDNDMRLARSWDALHPLPAPANVKIVNIRPHRDVALTMLRETMLRAMTLNG